MTIETNDCEIYLPPQSENMAYIGIEDGRVRAICRDDPGYEKSTAKMVANWIKEGRTVERVTVTEGMARIRADTPPAFPP